MKNRKISGILKYGPRVSNEVKKSFQAGGRLAIGEGYDYREDPYELALMRNESAQQIARTRADALRDAANTRANAAMATAKNKTQNQKLAGFAPITDGFPAANAYYNAELQKDVDQYNKFIETNPINSLPAQKMFNDITNKGIQLNSKGKQDKEEFNAAYGKLGADDLNMAAVTSTGYVAVRDNKSREISITSLGEYLDKDLGTKQIITLSDFADWKKNTDYKHSPELAQEFLVRGPLGQSKLDAQYIAPNKDAIMAISKEKMLTTTDEAGKSVQISADDFITTLTGSGAGSLAPAAAVSNRKAVDAILESLFPSITTASSNSPLMASLRSEALADNGFIKKLSEEGDKDKRVQMLHTKTLAILSKKLLRPLTGKTSDNEDTNSPEGPGGDNKAGTPPGAAPLLSLADGTVRTKVTFSTSSNQTLTLPAVEGALTPSDLKISMQVDTDKKETFKDHYLSNNTKYNSVAVVDKAYTLNGKLSPLLSSIGDMSPKSATNFLSTSPILASESSSLVLVPVDGDQNIAFNMLSKFEPVKKTTRLSFIKSMRLNGYGTDSEGKKIDIKLDIKDVSPNGFNNTHDKAKVAQARVAEAEYQRWLELANTYDENRVATTPEEKREKAVAKDAFIAMDWASKNMIKETGGKNMYMKAMYKTKIIVSSKEYPGLYDELKKQKVYGASSSDKHDNLRPVTDEEKEYVESLGKDTEFAGGARRGFKRAFGAAPEPEYFVMDILVPSKTLLEQGIATENLKTTSLGTIARLDELTNNKYLEAHAQTNLGAIKNIVNLLKR
jgi:hypothetical protein